MAPPTGRHRRSGGPATIPLPPEISPAREQFFAPVVPFIETTALAPAPAPLALPAAARMEVGRRSRDRSGSRRGCAGGRYRGLGRHGPHAEASPRPWKERSGLLGASLGRRCKKATAQEEVSPTKVGARVLSPSPSPPLSPLSPSLPPFLPPFFFFLINPPYQHFAGRGKALLKGVFQLVFPGGVMVA